MAFRKDYTGQKFGMLTAIEYSHRHNGKSFWVFKCECGTLKTLRLTDVTSYSTKSCGCTRGKKHRTHGRSRTKLYDVWRQMNKRCQDPKTRHYENYGGRGISVIKDWQDVSTFCEWAENNGYKNGLTLDRIDNNGNYEPSNCRWVNYTIQANNRTNNHWVLYKGKKYTVAELSRKTGLSRIQIKVRIKNGVIKSLKYAIKD